MTATLPYSPLIPQNPAECLRTNTCRYARYAEIHPSPPLKGLRGTRSASVSYRASVPAGHGCSGMSPSYRALAPVGAGLPSGNKGCRSDHPQPTANYSLLTAHSTFTFSAKERDPETGLSYFGSRYYNSDLSIWLSVDPMADKYPSLSPYTYCADNPVKLVDPNGERIYVGDDYYYRNGYLYYKGTEDVYVPEQGSYKVLLHNVEDGTYTPYLTKMLTSGGLPYVP